MAKSVGSDLDGVFRDYGDVLSEERFRLLAQATSDVVWDWNVRTDEVWWSDNLKTRFGYDVPDYRAG